MAAALGRTRKPVLDQEAFIQSALRLAQDPATAQLTFRDIGRDLGVDSTAIYRHFRTKEVFAAALLDRILQEIAELTITPIALWEQRLLEFAANTLRVFAKYPAISACAGTITTHRSGELACMELMLECFAQAGLQGGELVQHYAGFASYIISASTGLARETMAEHTDDSPAWFTGTLRVDPSRHPLSSALQEEILALDNESLFLAGAEQIIHAAAKK